MVAVDYDVLPAVERLPRRGEARRAAGACRHSRQHRRGRADGLRRRRRRLRQGARTCSRKRCWMHRGGGMAMETRAVLASYDAGERHAHGVVVDADAASRPRHARRPARRAISKSIRVIAPDVGGGFGTKAPFYPEEAVIPAAAMKLGRPVKWFEDRREHFLCATQERDQYWTVAIAVDADGKILGVRGSMLHDTGAFMPWGIDHALHRRGDGARPLRRAGLQARDARSRSPTRCRPRRCAAPAGRRRCSPWSG